MRSYRAIFSQLAQATKHAVASRTMFPAQSQHQRSIANAVMLKDLHSSLAPTRAHLSPMLGALQNHTGTLKRLYKPKAPEETLSPANKLANSLFHQQDNDSQFRTTNLRSLPAYSLTATLLAKIIYYLETDQLDKPEVRSQLHIEWRKQHKLMTTDSISISKINHLLDQISAVKKTYAGKTHSRNLAEGILLGFLYNKVSSRKEMLAYINELHRLNPIFQSRHPLPKDNDLYTANEIADTINKVTNLAYNTKTLTNHLQKNYEIMAVSFMAHNRLPEVIKAHYRYGTSVLERPNCVEAAIHNLCNILLYNETTHQFDFSLLPASLTPVAGLKTFYQQQNFSVVNVNEHRVGQAFFDLVSAHKFLEYKQENFELPAAKLIANFIPLMNYLLGCRASSFKELSAELSDEKRQIEFSHNEAQISVTLIRADQEKEDLIITASEKHAALEAKRFEDKSNIKEERNSFIFNLITQQASQSDKLIQAFQLNNYDLAIELLNAGADPDTLVNGNPLLFAITDHKAIQILVNAGANLKVTNRCGLSLLHASHSPEQIIALVQAGINPDQTDARGETPLFGASPEKITALIKAGANPNATNGWGLTPLFRDCTSGAIHALIDGGANPNARTIWGATPIFFASAGEIQTLVDRGADPNAKNNAGETALFQASSSETLEALIKVGIDPNATNNKGQTALFYCASIPQITDLIKFGTNPNALDKEGRSALFYLRNAEAIRALIQLGADPHIKDAQGWTPVEYNYNCTPEVREAFTNSGTSARSNFRPR